MTPEQVEFWTAHAVVALPAIGGLWAALVAWRHARRAARETHAIHTIVNSQRTEMIRHIEALRNHVASLQGELALLRKARGLDA